MQRRLFGTTRKGIPVHRFRLKSATGVSVDLMEYGASVVSIDAPDRFGHSTAVTLGHDHLEPYLAAGPTLAGTGNALQTRRVDALSGSVWWGEALGDGVRFHYRSPAGEDGRTVAIDCTVDYRLDASGVLRTEFVVKSEAHAPVDLMNRIPFNLAGRTGQSVMLHELAIESRERAACDHRGRATGHIEPIPPERICAQRIRDLASDVAPGHSQFYLTNVGGTPLATVARLADPESGRFVEISSSQPALRFTGITGEHGSMSAVLLCPQNLPSADRHAHFPSPWVTPDRPYHHATVYHFGIEP